MSIHVAENLEKHLQRYYREESPEFQYAVLYGLELEKEQNQFIVLMCSFCDSDVFHDPGRLQEYLDLNNQLIPTGLVSVGILAATANSDDSSGRHNLAAFLSVLNSAASPKLKQHRIVICCENAGANLKGLLADTTDTLREVPVTVKPNRFLQQFYVCFTLRGTFSTSITPNQNKNGITKAVEDKLMELQIENKSHFGYSLCDNSVFFLPGEPSVVVVKDGLRGVNLHTPIKDFVTVLEKNQQKAEKTASKPRSLPVSFSDLSGNLLSDKLLDISIHSNVSHQSSSEGSSPLLTVGSGATRLIRFQVDAFLFVPKEKALGELVEFIEHAKKRQFAALCEFLRRPECGSLTMEDADIPVPYHIINGPNILTLLATVRKRLTEDRVQDDLMQQLYSRFGFVTKDLVLHPYASLRNRVGMARKNLMGVGDKLLLKNSQFLNENPEQWDVACVQGLYTYHHYKQDRFDDDGWGCAYRSLQTIFSWFRLQGFTDLPIPTHDQIQKVLVEVKDRERSIIGSKQWIGATEITRVLEHILKVPCRFVTANSGSELSTAFASLKYHFETEGTPVMIGGGVYAHTIAGIAMNRVTGEVKALVVDPHYVGEDDIDLILKKNGVCWRTPEFWDQTAFYNLCCPLRPSLVNLVVT